MMNARGNNDFKVYISGDSSTWKEVTDITLNEMKKLDAENFENLYIKIEKNTSTIQSINLTYYKD